MSDIKTILNDTIEIINSINAQTFDADLEKYKKKFLGRALGLYFKINKDYNKPIHNSFSRCINKYIAGWYRSKNKVPYSIGTNSIFKAAWFLCKENISYFLYKKGWI